LTTGRRTVLALLGAGVLTGHSRFADADKLPVVGVLWHAANAEEEAAFRGPLREGFAALGYIDGKNIVFEDRYPAEDPERFERLAAELVGLKVDVLVAASIPSALAAQRATKTIPIVFVVNPDPVGLKLVSSLAHPGGNITGQSTVAYDLAAKRVEILKEAIPGLARVALLVNPNISIDKPRLLQEMQPATDKFGLVAEVVEADQPEKLDQVFREMADRRTGAVIVSQNPMFFAARRLVADLALKYRIPAMVPADLFVEAGALLSYGPAWPPLFRNAATFVDKILKGAKPADLPVEQPTVFDLTINRKTADTLGIALPQTLLLRADRVIE
jgi:putative tryptophan/tyrosine transport system substrate-binding protein